MSLDYQQVLLWQGADQSLRDNSLYRNPFTLGTGQTMDASGGKFGGGAIHGNGSVTSYAKAPHDARQRFAASGDFYVSAWVNVEGAGAQTYQVVVGKAQSGSQQFYFAFNAACTQLLFFHSTDGSGGSGVQFVSAPVTINFGQWYHVAASRSGGTVRIFLNGVQVASGTLTGTYANSSAALTVGGIDVSGYTYTLKGLINDAQLIVGQAVRTANFTPETAYLPSPVRAPYARMKHRVVPGASRGAAASVVDCKRESSTTFDVYHYGHFRVPGTVKADGSPDIPLHRKVVLLREPSMLPIAATWSDPVTGAYVFNNITDAYRYTVVAFDYEHNYRAVIADNLTAEAMP